MKKILSLILTLALLLNTVSLTVAAETSEDLSDEQELYLSYTAGQNGFYQYDSEKDEAVFVLPENTEDLAVDPVPATIEDDSTTLIDPYSVIGSEDSRKIVTNPTGQYESTCLIGMRFGPNSSDVFVGTGWLINDSYVATAGHNLYNSQYKNNGNNGYALHVAVYVGASGGNFKQYRLGHWHSVGGDYVANAATDYINSAVFDDWGTVKLDTPLTVSVKKLGRYPVNNSGDMYARTYWTQGYPADLNSGKWDNFYMYYTTGKILGNKTRSLACVYTNLDTYNGQSGSPIYSYRDGLGFCVEAIHVSKQDSTKNVAVLITPWLHNHFNSLS